MNMLVRIEKKGELADRAPDREDLAHWPSRPAEERVYAVEVHADNTMEVQQDFEELLAFFNAETSAT